MNELGVVYLVGAGPGNPDLLTVRAKKLLEKADVVAYDALISPSILSIIPPTTELISIGYRGYGSSKLGYGLHPTVIEMAKKGKTVVRLKSGDPFIFGRGYQECLDLTNEGIRFEVVPGISSSLGAAIYAGFPLTHKDYSSDVVFASGHDLRGGSASNSNWQALAQTGGTIVVFMAATKITENCQRLIEHGRKKSTPAIYIAAATCGNQKIIQGTLETLGTLTQEIDQKLQALIIVGEVINSRDKFDWRKFLPLRDKRLLLMRVRDQKSEMAMTLKNLGADVIEAPFIKTTDIFNESLTPLLKNHKNLMFSDQRTVQSFFNFLKKFNLDIREFLDHHFYTLDQTTSNKLKDFGIHSINIEGHCITALSNASLPSSFLILGPDLKRESLIEDLNSLNISSVYFPMIHTEAKFPDIPVPNFDGIIFASSSAVKLLEKSSWESSMGETPLFAIGDKTSKVLHELRKNVHQSSEDTRESLISLLINYWTHHE